MKCSFLGGESENQLGKVGKASFGNVAEKQSWIENRNASRKVVGATSSDGLF